MGLILLLTRFVFYSFWSYFNSESGAKRLGTGFFFGVILTPQYLG